MLPLLEPMLASTGPNAAPAESWAFEPKLDGWRALVHVDGDLTVRTRTTARAVRAQRPRLVHGASFAGLGPELFVACAALGLEGIVAKRLTSPYRPGERSRDWVKAKSPDWRTTRARVD